MPYTDFTNIDVTDSNYEHIPFDLEIVISVERDFGPCQVF